MINIQILKVYIKPSNTVVTSYVASGGVNWLLCSTSSFRVRFVAVDLLQASDSCTSLLRVVSRTNCHGFVLNLSYNNTANCTTYYTSKHWSLSHTAYCTLLKPQSWFCLHMRDSTSFRFKSPMYSPVKIVVQTEQSVCCLCMSVCKDKTCDVWTNRASIIRALVYFHPIMNKVWMSEFTISLRKLSIWLVIYSFKFQFISAFSHGRESQQLVLFAVAERWCELQVSAF